jgi:hypothetical protein
MEALNAAMQFVGLVTIVVGAFLLCGLIMIASIIVGEVRHSRVIRHSKGGTR